MSNESPDKPGKQRPVVGSRNPTGRPRKVAGQRQPPVAGPVEPPLAVVDPVPAPEAEPETRDERADARAGRLLGGPRTTPLLVLVIVLLVGALAFEGWYVWGRGEPVVSAKRPVVTGEIAHRAAVEAASQEVTDILTYGYQDFDAQIEDATDKMTDSFAEQFRDTAAAVKDDFVKDGTEQEVKVIAASVVQASPEQVQALLFLDQYVAKKGKGTAVTPYRALVTVVHTDAGWLVSNIETK